MTLEVQQFVRKAFPVDAVRVTPENMEEAAKWCDGTIRMDDSGSRYIKVRVLAPLNERQTMAYVGDWLLYAGKGYKVYLDKAFRKSFGEHEIKAQQPIGMAPTPITPVDQNVFEGQSTIPGMSHTSSSPTNPGGGHG